ncbi:hypothetical protein GA0061084_1096 [Arthrobacter sp. NIO-1057]|nr:hypothetical protein GA0061084_1096 [Arthrobacter sp. NIO-1057]
MIPNDFFDQLVITDLRVQRISHVVITCAAGHFVKYEYARRLKINHWLRIFCQESYVCQRTLFFNVMFHCQVIDQIAGLTDG